MGPYTAKSALVSRQGGNLVENDPNKATLLVHAGGTLPRDVAERWANRKRKPPPRPPANKARAKAPANKSKAE